ncbi:hypothetical protein OCH239_10900 [Roseivivax halodurans JCM 10272]|uniref:Uncharacterized protein n=1 Tax=Roseivivax halodurans JCM 10272 TaxID=1449350 RepID=X7EDZ0_9RHOB|nr:hypothetical protein [Roseivivax halodurans]ETX13343.1 hypothetical protein OCH239_10900 [Roseivivax halodurans JCM 10272]
MGTRVARLSFGRFDWLKEPWCWIRRHHEVCMPCAPSETYVGTYCLRCGAHWNHAEMTGVDQA